MWRIFVRDTASGWEGKMNEKQLINIGKAVIYMDSILIFTKTLNEHPEIIDWALKNLEQDNFTLQSKKFYQTKINTSWEWGNTRSFSILCTFKNYTYGAYRWPYVPHKTETNNVSPSQSLEPSVILYQVNQLADLQLWDGNFCLISLFGVCYGVLEHQHFSFSFIYFSWFYISFLLIFFFFFFY